MSEDAHTTSRRGFLDYVIALFSAITGLALAIPGLLYLWPAARGGGKATEVPGAADMGVDEAKMIQVGGKAVVVVRGRKGFAAFSAACTHLGCLVKWDRNKKEFLCPCHGAVFDRNGAVVAGPPPKPLPTYRVKEIGNKVVVVPA